jgi:hypothetical protein
MIYLANNAMNPTATTVYGNVFQWGRKAAIPRSGNTQQGAVSDPAPNHTDFIYNTSSPYNWYNGASPDALWGNGSAITAATPGAGSVLYNGNYYQRPVKTANDPCPAGWRLPTQDEWERLGDYNCNPTSGGGSVYSIPATGKATTTGFTWVPVVCANGECRPNGTWTSQSTRSGYVIYRTSDLAGHTITTATDLIDDLPVEPYLFLPATGYRHNINGAQDGTGGNGYYWSSSINGTNAYRLTLGGSYFYPDDSSYRAYGFSVRCVRE